MVSWVSVFLEHSWHVWSNPRLWRSRVCTDGGSDITCMSGVRAWPTRYVSPSFNGWKGLAEGEFKALSFLLLRGERKERVLRSGGGGKHAASLLCWLRESVQEQLSWWNKGETFQQCSVSQAQGSVASAPLWGTSCSWLINLTVATWSRAFSRSNTIINAFYLNSCNLHNLPLTVAEAGSIADVWGRKDRRGHPSPCWRSKGTNFLKALAEFDQLGAHVVY